MKKSNVKKAPVKKSTGEAAMKEQTVMNAWGNAIGTTYDAAKQTVNSAIDTAALSWEESSTTTKVVVVGGIGAVAGAVVYATLFR